MAGSASGRWLTTWSTRSPYDVEAAWSSCGLVWPNPARRSRWAASPRGLVSWAPQSPLDAPATDADVKRPGSLVASRPTPAAPATLPAARPRAWRRLQTPSCRAHAGPFSVPILRGTGVPQAFGTFSSRLSATWGRPLGYRNHARGCGVEHMFDIIQECVMARATKTRWRRSRQLSTGFGTARELAGHLSSSARS